MRCSATPHLRAIADELADTIPDDAIDVLEREGIEFIKSLGPHLLTGGSNVHPGMLDLLDDLCARFAEEATMEDVNLKEEAGSVARAYLRDAEVAEIMLVHARNTKRNDIALIERARDLVKS